MAEFTVNGVRLDVPDDRITPQLAAALGSGRYEHSEAGALAQHLSPADRLLDLGAGAGYLIALGSRLAAAVAGVEADAAMAEVARANLARNGGTGEVVAAALVPDDHAAEVARFAVRPSFWASSLTKPAAGKPWVPVEVPVLRLGDALARFRPTVLSVDLEGGEAGLFDAPLAAQVRLVVMELHPQVYGRAGVKRIFDGLSQAGFAYCPAGSAARLVVFERVSRARA